MLNLNKTYSARKYEAKQKLLRKAHKEDWQDCVKVSQNLNILETLRQKVGKEGAAVLHEVNKCTLEDNSLTYQEKVGREPHDWDEYPLQNIEFTDKKIIFELEYMDNDITTREVHYDSLKVEIEGLGIGIYKQNLKIMKIEK